jgi:hypothetical protein
MTKPTIYYPFIRIPKTGSTSILHFLHDYSGLRPLNAYLPAAQSNKHSSYAVCAFGSLPSNVTTGRGNCAHYNYQQHLQMMEGLGKYLPPHNDKNMKVQPFTIVREPFEQMQSLFYYTKKVKWEFQHYSNRTKRLIQSGDLEGYLRFRSLAKQTPLTGASAQQWQFLNGTSFQSAVEAIESGEVLALLNECFEASLRLVEHLFSPVVKAGAVDAFLASPNVRANRGSYYGNSSNQKLLQEKVRMWYHKEYQFYNAAVKKFQQQWAGAGLNASVLKHECVYLSSVDYAHTMG